jgi:hypothetical protein
LRDPVCQTRAHVMNEEVGEDVGGEFQNRPEFRDF